MLAIERNWRMRKLIRANLEALGLEVREAVSEEDGLQRLRECLPDLILLDLPDEEALHLLHSFQYERDGQAIPVIVMFAEPPSRKFMQCEQVAGHLLKPFAAPALLEEVQKVLGGLSRGD